MIGFAGALFLEVGAVWFVVVYGGFGFLGVPGWNAGFCRGVLVLGFLWFGVALIWAGWVWFSG